MQIPPKVQTAVIDVAQWHADAEFAVFPQGARAKDALFAPADGPHSPLCRPDWRYLFKRSKRSYPDQFWGEVIAYRIGCRMGLEVPPAFAAINSSTGHSAALIEWFYDDAIERFVLAGDFLSKLYPEFDRDKGKRHNLLENSALLRALTMSKGVVLETDWRSWWVDALLFDALIGNTDRHQDNWGLVFRNDGATMRSRMAPLFDNGTSLGHERFVEKTLNWTEAEVRKYCAKGTHHARWSMKDDPPLKGHLPLLHQALGEWSDTRERVKELLSINIDEIGASISDLPALSLPVPLTTERLAFILRLLSHRLASLQHAFL